jgi:hypothetical protein
MVTLEPVPIDNELRNERIPLTGLEPVPIDNETIQLAGNEKRIDSCRKVGGAKKREGHKLEEKFNRQFGSGNEVINYGASADCDLDPTNTNTIDLNKKVKDKWGIDGFKRVSCKSKNNIQFTLGNIPEITTKETEDEKKSVWKEPSLWDTHLGKSNSKRPADALVYNTGDEWVFFKMTDVITFIANNVIVRYLDTGRMKGDFEDGSKKGIRQYLTFEYRETHKSYFLGANGGRGGKFIELLKSKIEYVVIPVEDK